MLQLIKKMVIGDMPVNTSHGWKQSFAINSMQFADKHIVSINGIDIYTTSDSVVGSYADNFINFLKVLDTEQNYKIVVTNRRGYAHVHPPKHHQLKAEFLEEYEDYINSEINVRNRSIYMLFDKNNGITDQIRSAASLTINEDARQDFYKDMSYFFGGKGEPFFYPLEKWEYGVKIGPRYGVTLMHLLPVEDFHMFHHHILNSIMDDFIFVIAFSFPSVLEAEKKTAGLKKQMDEKISDASREVGSELGFMIKELSLGREKLLYVTASLTVFDNSPHSAIKKAKNISDTLKNHGLTYEIEGTVEFESFMFLFDYDVNRAKSLSLARKYPLRTFAHLLPFSSSTRGAPSGELYFNDAGEKVYVDPYYASSMHCTTLGHTGSGKSMLAQSRDAYCDLLVVVEKIAQDEGSYRYSVPYFGGHYCPISLDRPVPLNSFGESIHVPDYIRFVEDIGYRFSDFSERDLIMTGDMLSHLCGKDAKHLKKDELLDVICKHEGAEFLSYKLTDAKWDKWTVQRAIDRNKLSLIVTALTFMVAGDSEHILPENVSVLEQAVLKAYEMKPADKFLGTSDIARALDEMKEKVFATRMRSFTMAGRFGPLFDRPSDMPDGDIYYEIRISEPEVLYPGMLLILNHTLKTFSHPKHFGKRKKVRLDESWFFRAHPYLAKSTDEMVRTFRKKQIELDFDSQSHEDFTGEGNIISGQCEHNFFLFNKSENLPIIKSAFQLSDKEINILGSIKPPKEYGFKYSKFYLRSTYGCGPLYCIPSRKLYWLGTTRPEDKIAREKKKSETKDLYEAINQLAKSHV